MTNEVGRFARCRNNGVTAIMTTDEWGRVTLSGTRASHQVNWEDAIDEGARIFTFCSAKRLLLSSTWQAGYFTGLEDDLESLLRGSIVTERDFFVPFSRGGDRIRSEKMFIVTRGDLIEAFGEHAKTSLM